MTLARLRANAGRMCCGALLAQTANEAEGQGHDQYLLSLSYRLGDRLQQSEQEHSQEDIFGAMVVMVKVKLLQIP